MKNTKKIKRAFTLIELLIVIAIIGILFIVLVSRVDFATDKAKATGVQTDFRSFQVALETVSKENAGFASLGWNTGDDNGDRIRNSYDEGDIGAGVGTPGYHNGKVDSGEIWTGHKVYGETWGSVYTLVNPADNTDTSAFEALESVINANLDPKLHITITPELSGTALTGNAVVSMANGAQDPWKKEYHGVYITNAERDNGADRGAFVIYSDGANGKNGSEHKIDDGIVTVTVPGNNIAGKDDYSLIVGYTNVNGYGETKVGSTGFSNNQSFLSGGNNGGVAISPEQGTNDVTFPTYDTEVLMASEYILFDGSDTSVQVCTDGIYMNGSLAIPSACLSFTGNQMTVSNTGAFDGVFTFCDDGYLEWDGDVVGKSVEAWINVPVGSYLVVRNDTIFVSEDGNALLYAYGTKDELYMALNEFMLSQEYLWLNDNGFLNFAECKDQLMVSNVFDFLSMQNMLKEGIRTYAYDGEWISKYKYYGGFAWDTKTTYALTTNAHWFETDLYGKFTTSLYAVSSSGRKRLTTADKVVNGLYAIETDKVYLHNGVETTNVMFFEDYALYYEDGMTYREWMRKYYPWVMNDSCSCTSQHSGLYIPEEYLDNLCEPGYRQELQTSPIPAFQHSQLGFYQADGYFSWEYVFYSYGKATIGVTPLNVAGYEYIGAAWKGGIQADNTIYIDEYCNYFLRQGISYNDPGFGSGFDEAFKPTTNTVIDISEYLTYSNNCLTIDVVALQSVYNLSDDIEFVPIKARDDYYLDCSIVSPAYSNGYTGTFIGYQRKSYTFKTNSSLGIYDVESMPTGITFYYNGVVYTGFAN